jgi:hypothetical protein
MWRVDAKKPLNSVTVLLNAAMFYEVGFIDVKTSRQWSFSSTKILRFRSMKIGSQYVSVDYESPLIPNLADGARDDVFVASRVGSGIEFARNGQKLDVNFEECLKKVPGHAISATDKLTPFVYLNQQGDSVTLLDFKE